VVDAIPPPRYQCCLDQGGPRCEYTTENHWVTDSIAVKIVRDVLVVLAFSASLYLTIRQILK
jgi:hypothetical protein